MSAYRPPHSKSRGHGAGHWISERVSSLCLVPLTLWAVYAGLHLATAGFAQARLWMQAPVNAVLTLLLMGVTFWHMHDGLRVVIEDYIQKTFSKALLLFLNFAVCAVAGVLAVLSILKIALMVGY